jgi:hypothetical protein
LRVTPRKGRDQPGRNHSREEIVEPASYREHPIRNPSVTEVLPDDRRRFVVVSGIRSRTDQAWTLVLEWQDDYWISRRELLGAFAPDAAVSGYLFDREGAQDPVDLLRRMNELVRGEYYRILEGRWRGSGREDAAECGRGMRPAARRAGRRRPPAAGPPREDVNGGA